MTLRLRKIRSLVNCLMLFPVIAAFSPSGARAEEISVTQYGQSLYGLPYAVALEKGLFKKAGIDITGILSSGGGGTTVRNILASPTPYGEVAVSAALAAQRQGLDVVIVNVGTRSVAESSVVTMPNSGIKTVADLVGKKVAITSPKGVSEMLLMMVLEAKGIDPNKVTRVASGGYVNSLTMLEQGAVSAAALIEPLSIIRKDKYATVYKTGDVLKPMTTSVGITTRKFAKESPDKLRAIIAGRRAGVDALYADPAGAAKILERDFKLTPAVAKEAVDNMIRPKMWSEGNFNQAELDRMIDGLRLIGEVNGPVDWSTLIDLSYLPADLKGK
ncbi:MAG: transporter substrate-binding protein [Herbaspirillum sp.]|nr:transporter substrate-binding protein [Herbaspirillum sp.]